MRLTELQKAALRNAAARARLAAEGIDLSKPLPGERDFLVPSRTDACGSQVAYLRHKRAGEAPCAACRDAHARLNNPDLASGKMFDEECWGRLE